MNKHKRNKAILFSQGGAGLARSITVLFAIFMLSVILGACTIRIGPSVKWQKSAYPAKIINDAGLRIETDQTDYPMQTEYVRFTLYNDSNAEGFFGARYDLEMLQKDTWYNVPFKGVEGDAEPTWIAIGYNLPSNGQFSDKVNLSHHVPGGSGRYRLIKEINLDGSQEPIVLAVEFVITETSD